MLDSIFKTWLFIGPHPDDVELGCGGTISKYSRRNLDMYYVIVSPALEDPRNANILHEMEESARILGLRRENIKVLKYPRRVLHEHRSDVRQELYRIVQELDPDVIFTTTPGDLHQDHALVGEEVVRLFRDSSILGYEVVNSSSDFVSNFYVELDKESLARKIGALQKYKSQSQRYYFNAEVIRSLARTRGAHTKRRYAEAFKVLRMVVK